MRKILLLSLCFISVLAMAQQPSKADKKAMKRMQKTIEYLSSDQLEGRRTGSVGEEMAYRYIIEQFRTYNISPKGENGGYLQPFLVDEGKVAGPTTAFFIDEVSLKSGSDFFPLPYSANTPGLLTKLSFKDSAQAWLVNLKDTLLGAKTNPHFDVNDYLLSAAKNAQASGAAAVIFYNSGSVADGISFDAKDKTPVLSIPVLYLNDKHITEKVDVGSGTQLIKIVVDIAPKTTTGHNVVGFVDNKAKSTIIIGAHYDHLGYGQDHNSLYVGTQPMVHNGADDNASGVAAMVELARYLKKSPLRAYNYLFIAFSGEELGLYGSKYFTKNSPINLTTVNYMVNLDMVGRLNPETKGLTIGGYGTSPYWGKSIKADDGYFKIKLDSSGIGPSDHTSFYTQDIPVLFFFTGTHSDYHKPSDDADKINIEGTLHIINYIKQLMIETNYENKLAFTKTREVNTGKSSFKVSLGIMPDYTFSGSGVLAEGISEGKPAQKAGLQKGDVLVQLGDFPFTDVQSYMNALNKFEKGDTTILKFMREGKEMQVSVTF